MRESLNDKQASLIEGAQSAFFDGTEPCHDGEAALWRERVAESVAAHRARRGKRVQDIPPESSSERRRHAQQLSERALENVRRRVEERIAREDAERREREEIERFFAAQPRTVVTESGRNAAIDGHREPSNNLIEFPRLDFTQSSSSSAAAAMPARIPDPAPDQLTIFEDSGPAHNPPDETVLDDVDLADHPALRLDDPPAHDYLAHDADPVSALGFELPLQVAPVALRMQAALIDSAIVCVAASAFGGIFYATAHSVPRGRASALIIAITLGLIWSLYQIMFLIYSGTTPGMNAVRLAISDFADNVPEARTRAARAVSLVLVCLSCGLGFLWALLDEDHLGWHDRMTRTYPRQLA
jgi:uncharacterized RDD family membrane protein YckC